MDAGEPLASPGDGPWQRRRRALLGHAARRRHLAGRGASPARRHRAHHRGRRHPRARGKLRRARRQRAPRGNAAAHRGLRRPRSAGDPDAADGRAEHAHLRGLPVDADQRRHRAGDQPPRRARTGAAHAAYGRRRRRGGGGELRRRGAHHRDAAAARRRRGRAPVPLRHPRPDGLRDRPGHRRPRPRVRRRRPAGRAHQRRRANDRIQLRRRRPPGSGHRRRTARPSCITTTTPLDGASFAHTAGRLAWVDEPTGIVQHGYDAFGRRGPPAPLGARPQRRAGDPLRGVGAGARAPATTTASRSRSPTTPPAAPSRSATCGSSNPRTPPVACCANASATASSRPTRATSSARRATSRCCAPPAPRCYEAEVAHNAYGAITTVTDLDGVGLDHTAAFTYDGGARLVNARPRHGAAAYHFAYHYDGLQNMVAPRRRRADRPRRPRRRSTATASDRRHGPRQLTSVLADGAGAAPTTFALRRRRAVDRPGSAHAGLQRLRSAGRGERRSRRRASRTPMATMGCGSRRSRRGGARRGASRPMSPRPPTGPARSTCGSANG